MIKQATIHEETLAPLNSILFERPEGSREPEAYDEPAFFHDLNLDQVLEMIVSGREEYEIRPFFYESLDCSDDIRYRQEIFRDLENKALFEAISSFADRMRIMRLYLGMLAKLHYKRLKQGWFLEAVETYCAAVVNLSRDLAATDVTSRGFRALREYIAAYIESPAFVSLLRETKRLKEELSEVKYCIHIKGDRVRVRRYESEADYSAEVLKIFEKFKHGAATDYRVGFSDDPGMNHVEAAILDRVALLFGEEFSSLADYCARYRDYLDETINRLDREVQFYLAYLEFIEQIRAAGLRFCYPEVSERSKEIFANETFDLALAAKLLSEEERMVYNDFHLDGPERIIVITGPNQGGKTTFARMFGQLHHLASIGCPVPGREARLFLYDRLFTHFEREEDSANLKGKLEYDLLRIKEIFKEATSNSIIIINEIFASTTLSDALFLGKKVMEKIIQLDLLCVLVTFVDELTRSSDSTVSMVGMVSPDNPAQRTYKVVRRPADGLAYATAIAEKHGLTYEHLKGRLSP